MKAREYSPGESLSKFDILEMGTTLASAVISRPSFNFGPRPADAVQDVLFQCMSSIIRIAGEWGMDVESMPARMEAEHKARGEES